MLGYNIALMMSAFLLQYFTNAFCQCKCSHISFVRFGTYYKQISGLVILLVTARMHVHHIMLFSVMS